MTEVASWLAKKAFYILGCALIVLLMLIAAVANDNRDASAKYFAFSAVLVLGLMVWLWFERTARVALEARTSQLSSKVIDDPERAQRVEEFYRLSEYYQKRAASNAVTTIAILIILAVSVMLAGQVASLDLVKFQSISGYANEIESRRNVILNAGSRDWDKRSVDSANDGLKEIQAALKTALDQQTTAEAGLAGPIYRIFQHWFFEFHF